MKSLSKVKLFDNTNTLKKRIQHVNNEIKLHREKTETAALQFNFKRAGVLIAIFEHNNHPFVLLTQRSENLKFHKSEVALPGGKQDPSDVDIVETAIRESEEEIGLNRKHIKVVGVLQPYFTYVTRLLVYPVIAFLMDTENIKLNINEEEVGDVFAVPLQFFLWNDMHSKKVYEHASYNFFHWIRNDTVLGDDDIHFLQVSNTHKTNKKFTIYALTAFCCILASILLFNEMPEEGIIFDSADTINEVYQRMSQFSYSNVLLSGANSRL